MVIEWIDPQAFRWLTVAVWLTASAVGLVVCGGNYGKARRRRKEFFLHGPEFQRRGIVHRHRIQRRLFTAMFAAATVGVLAAAIPRPAPISPVTLFSLVANSLLLGFIALISSLSTEVRRYELEQFAVAEEETLLETISAQFGTDLESSMRNLMDRLERALERMEAGDLVVAEGLEVAQQAVDGVASDLLASHDRADAVHGSADPGSAADAASQSGG